MKRTLSVRLILWFLLYGVAGFIILSTFTTHLTTQTAIDQEVQSLHRESAIIAARYAISYYSDEISLEEFQEQMEALSTYLNGEIHITNQSGELLIDSTNSSVFRMASTRDLLALENFNMDVFGDSYYIIDNFFDHYEQDVLTVYAPITLNYKVRGYVFISKSMNKINATSTLYTNLSFYSVGIFFLCGLSIMLIISYTIILPIRKIISTANNYAKGDFTKKIEIQSSGEIGYLANTLNYMATELNTLEDEQRKFVSNVSHDFRSPLTSIKGYIEAMIDGTIPVEMQEKYLNIILFETERLNKLTRSLLDLNQFGHHGVRLDKADFDINQMIRNTLLTFEGTCQSKGITFEVILTGHELFVTGDMTKIQQVIYNLIDNAIKFSHHNSSIKVETKIKNEKCFVSIKDRGLGIPADSINKIWDRFYKTDLSRGKDKKGTGLGLSIVKEILSAHNETIDCISTEGVGTEFVFTLTLSKRES